MNTNLLGKEDWKTVDYKTLLEKTPFELMQDYILEKMEFFRKNKN